MCWCGLVCHSFLVTNCRSSGSFVHKPAAHKLLKHAIAVCKSQSLVHSKLMPENPVALLLGHSVTVQQAYESNQCISCQ
jgi:hypothetical protein